MRHLDRLTPEQVRAADAEFEALLAAGYAEQTGPGQAVANTNALKRMVRDRRDALLRSQKRH